VRARNRNTDDLSRRHTTPPDGNVFADLGFPPEKAAALLRNADAQIEKARTLKVEAAQRIAGWIKDRHMSQLDAAHILAVSRPRVSDLVNLKIARFSLDCLVGMLLRVGQDVHLAFRGTEDRTSPRRQSHRRASA
jgi:predicted XRE-type DNA-binding protein